jgi:hypothetical protein
MLITMNIEILSYKISTGHVNHCHHATGSFCISIQNACNKSSINSYIFRDITLRSLAKYNRTFGGKHCLHLHSRRLSYARNQQLHVSLFHSGDEGYMFLLNVG